MRWLVSITAVALGLVVVGSASADSPAVHITALSYRGGVFNPTFKVSFSFDGCSGWCLVDGTPVFSLHRGLNPDGPSVALATYLYGYDFSDMPVDPNACYSSPCTVSGTTQLKPSYVQCRFRRRRILKYTVVVSATVTSLSGDYPVFDFRSMQVVCKGR